MNVNEYVYFYIYTVNRNLAYIFGESLVRRFRIWEETFYVTSTLQQQTFRTILLSIINKKQRYTTFFIIANALHVSGGFFAHHQELKNCTRSIGSMPRLLAATASVGEFQLTNASGNSKFDGGVCSVVDPMLRVQLLSSWWWAEKPPETCRALTIIKNIL